MNFFGIDCSLTQEQKDHIKNVAALTGFEPHVDPKKEKYHNLDTCFPHPNQLECITDMFLYQPNRVSVVKVEPNKSIKPHSDGKMYGRQTAVVFPIYPKHPDFAPCNIHVQESVTPIPAYDCYAFDTYSLHSVYNNEHRRLNLQLWYSESCADLYQLYVDGKLLRDAYRAS